MRTFPLLGWHIALATAARFSLPEDPYAFPKYRVTFLNPLPLTNETAERWLKSGLQGGILEFMDQPWQESTLAYSFSSPKEIESGEPVDTNQKHHESNYSLERIKMGPKDTFLCFVPKPLDPPRLEVIDEEAELSPIRGWQLLQPLTGTCLYLRHGWFTYSYCHNHEIRQFKELAQVPTSPGSYRPAEDPNHHAYTLGKAPPTPEPGKELTVAEKKAIAANVELAKGAGSRYLVQRWGDGTVCDKTGKKREVEVQFHCSMDGSDHIFFIKETRTCAYLIVIHTPRLCSEPGFRNPYDIQEEALIRCREVVPTGSLNDPAIREQFKTLPPETAHPIKFKHKRPASPPPPSLTPPKSSNTDDKAADVGKLQDLIKKALSASGIGKGGTKIVMEKHLDNGEVVFEVVGDEVDDDEVWDSQVEDTLSEVLRAAGWGLKKENKQGKDANSKKKKAKGSNEGKGKNKPAERRGRIEL